MQVTKVAASTSYKADDEAGGAKGGGTGFHCIHDHYSKISIKNDKDDGIPFFF